MKTMEFISATNKALEQLEEFLNKMGGGIASIKNLSVEIDAGYTAVELPIYFKVDRILEYISQLPQQGPGTEK